MIRTRWATLPYRLGAGPFTTTNLKLTTTIAGHRATANPTAGSAPGNPTQPSAPYTKPAPNPTLILTTLILTAYPGTRGRFSLYDDQGVGFAYQRGQRTITTISQARHGRQSAVTIRAAKGNFPGALPARAWQLELLGVARPRHVALEIGHRTLRLVAGRASRGWTYSAAARTLTVDTGPISTRHDITVRAR